MKGKGMVFLAKRGVKWLLRRTRLETPLLFLKYRLRFGDCPVLDPPEYMVDTSKHIVYLVVSKAACTSIKAAMYDADLPDDYSVHARGSQGTIRKTRKLEEREKAFFSFTFVRNPYDRLVSAYESKYHEDIKKGYRWFESRKYLNGYLTKDKGFDRFVKRVCRIPDELLDRHINSQYMLTHDAAGRQTVMFIGDYERLEEQFEKLRRRWPMKPLPHYNNSGGAQRDWRAYYTPQTARMVYKKYRKDFETFGYAHYYNELLEYLRQNK